MVNWKFFDITHRADLELLEMDDADYRAEPETFDLASCLGASWTLPT